MGASDLMSELIEMHLRHLQAANYSPDTVKDRERLLRYADAVLPYGIDTSTTRELEAFLANPDWSPWTRVTYHSHLTGFYRWASAGDDAYLDYNPAAALARPRDPNPVPHPVTDDELARALGMSSPKWQLVITLAAYAGLRVAEIAMLEREHVTDRYLHVVRGKGGKEAWLPTHPEIWRLVSPMPDGLLVLSGRGRKYTPNALSSSARWHFDAIGMPRVHLHRFRHWYATAMIANGADISVVRTLMRHDSLNTTAGYVEIVDGQRRLAICTLPVASSPQQEAA